jgi:uncharacterized repeat protein (TIGR03803 family)
MTNAQGNCQWAAAIVAATLMVLAAIAAPAQDTVSFTTLHSLDYTDGWDPEASLVQGIDGNLYGTTPYGGGYGDGNVFKITPAGTPTTIYSFGAEGDCRDGVFPVAGLVLGTDENFYGTTFEGGAGNEACINGRGTVFKLTSDGTLTTLHRFAGMDGAYPYAGLIQATDGDLYGTTAFGGVYNSCKEVNTPPGCGTVFKITPEGIFTVLHSFTGGTDGGVPYGPLVEGSDGNLYGTAFQGGGSLGDGVIFKITPGGTMTTLHSFDYSDGANPYAGLIQAGNGKFYGTTYSGGAGCYIECGTVFDMTQDGALTTLGYVAFPVADLIQATDGNLYGASSRGGANCLSGFNSGCGSVFRLTPNGELGALYSFCSLLDCADGEIPWGGLVQATDGTFYGTTELGGANTVGTVFSLATGLGPFVTVLPKSRAIGQRVAILGNNLTGSTSVTFNGIPATFTVVSSTEISTTVPAAAATGPVQVVTPSGTLTSNVNFQVLP